MPGYAILLGDSNYLLMVIIVFTGSNDSGSPISDDSSPVSRGRPTEPGRPGFTRTGTPLGTVNGTLSSRPLHSLSILTFRFSAYYGTMSSIVNGSGTL